MKLFRGEIESQSGLDVALLRRYTLLLLSECPPQSAAVLRHQVGAARTSEELARMRGAIFQCMAMHLGEVEAMERITSFDLSV